MNLLTRLNWEARVAATEGRADAARGELARVVNDVADYFLFVDEAPPPARLTPRPDFAARFTSRGPADARGRALRELDLSSRLLKYPCSFMIYSEAFDHLPAAARHAVYRRMSFILSDDNSDPKYERLSPADRRNVREILAATKPDWP